MIEWRLKRISAPQRIWGIFWRVMFKFIKNLFNSDNLYYCLQCRRVLDEYGNDLPKCKCGKQLNYEDRISENKRQILEIKDEINEDE